MTAQLITIVRDGDILTAFASREAAIKFANTIDSEDKQIFVSWATYFENPYMDGESVDEAVKFQYPNI